jgi:predicted DNA repair protein MutK
MERVYAAVLAGTTLLGIVWLWVNLSMDSLLLQVIAVAVLGLVWAAIVYGIGGVVAAVIGVGATITKRPPQP